MVRCGFMSLSSPVLGVHTQEGAVRGVGRHSQVRGALGLTANSLWGEGCLEIRVIWTGGLGWSDGMQAASCNPDSAACASRFK